MAAKPTTAQETAIREAIDNNRIVNHTAYADRTLTIMQRNRWVICTGNTYRITPEAVRALFLFTLADRYRRDDLLATDPKAQRQAAIAAEAEMAGIHTDITTGSTEMIRIRVEDLAILLAAFRPAPAM